jgi:hypothetical protein
LKKIGLLAFSIFMCSLLLLPGEGQARDAGLVLKDIKGHWAASYIDHGFGMGILHGYEDNTFKPNKQVTTAQFLKMITLAKGLEAPADIEVPYTDVHKSDWYYPYAAAAFHYKLLPPGTSRLQPNKAATREEMAYMAAAALGLEPSGKIRFADSGKMKHPGYVEAAAEAGLIKGYPDGTYKPEALLTRAQAAKVVSLAKTYKDENEMFKMLTVDTAAAFYEIMDGRKPGEPFSDYRSGFKPYFTGDYIEQSILPYYKNSYGTDWMLIPNISYGEVNTRFSVKKTSENLAIIETFRATTDMTPGGIYKVTFKKTDGRWRFHSDSLEKADLQLSRKELEKYTEYYYTMQYRNAEAEFQKEGKDRFGDYVQFYITGKGLAEEARVYKKDAYINTFFEHY